MEDFSAALCVSLRSLGITDAFDAENAETNTFYGDGSPIEPEVLDQLREPYRREIVVFSWQANDVLLLGKVLVGMAHPYSLAADLI